jgi:hypothetical protein
MVKRVIVSAGVVLLLNGSAWAQPAPITTQKKATSKAANDKENSRKSGQAGPAYRGLFAADARSGISPNELSLFVAVYEEYGSSPDVTALAGRAPLSMQSGLFTGVRTDLMYSHRGDRTTVGFRTDAGLRYYSSIGATTELRYRSELGLSTVLGRMRRTSLSTALSVEASPSYSLSLFPGQSVLNDPGLLAANRDDMLTARAAMSYNGSIGFGHEFSPRSSIGFDTTFRYATVTGAPGVRDARVGVRFGRRLSRNVGVRLGYAYMQGQYGQKTAVNTMETHDLDLGVDYQKPLTRSRRTTLALGSGSTLVQMPDGKQYRVTAAANLRSELPKGWVAQLDYSRGVQLVEGFANPFFADTVTPSLGGYLTRRIQLSTGAGYSVGQVGLVGNRYRAMQASARLQVAATRFAAVDAQYLFYRYGFDDGIELFGGLRQSMDLSSVRINLTLWLPLFR